WLWAEHEGLATPAQMAQSVYDQIPAGDPFWSLRIGDPGVAQLFDGAVYIRGAMALQALRAEVGDQDFWRIIRTWAESRSGGTGTTPQLIALAERVSGHDLAPLFDAWLYTGAKPAAAGAATAASWAAGATFGTSATSAHGAAYARQWLAALQRQAGLAQRGR
ncbi:MAG TPA: M1 family peptidase, partial [Pedococcus sp.]|nr:M1 family peptidase [Pedococcus sp.]